MISAARLAGAELRRLRGPLPKLALTFILLVPLLYGALYLWSNWDPYGRLDQVPVAVVNQDQAVSVDGRTIDAGDQFVAQLQQDKIFDWHFVEQSEAQDGLRDGRYYLVITVPDDFSQSLASGTGNDPMRATLLLHRDDHNGYVIGMLTDSVRTELEAAIDQAAIGAYFEAVFTNLQTIRGDVQQAADGAAQLASGAASAVSGGGELAGGLTSAKDGSGQLVSGLDQARSGSGELASGAVTAQQGAAQLAAGVADADQGAVELDSGLQSLQTGSGQLVTGADQVAQGTQQLADAVVPALDAVAGAIPGLQQLNTDFDALVDRDSGAVQGELATLNQQVQQLPDSPARTQLLATLQSLTGRVSQAAAAVDTVTAALDAQGSTLQSDLTTAAGRIDQLAQGAAEVADGAQDLDQGIADAASGAAALSSGLGTAATGAQDLDTGLTTLVTGAQQLDAGIGALQTGAQQLDDGLGTAQTGLGTLNDGLNQLSSGSTQLADQLTAGAQRIPALDDAQAGAAASVLSQPVAVSTTIDNAAGTYGRGLAPFFFSIAIWVFGITAFLVLRPGSPRALIGRASPVRLALAGWFPVLGIGAAGAMILFAVAWFALGLDPVNVGVSIGVVLLATVCFTAIAYLLRAALGVVGSAISLVLLMVQLTSCGGIYPVETLPLPLRAIHPFMPMSYLVDALRVGFTGGPADLLLRDVLVLAGVALVALVGCVLVVRGKQRMSVTTLHPALTA
jgi:putative membrane protein